MNPKTRIPHADRDLRAIGSVVVDERALKRERAEARRAERMRQAADHAMWWLMQKECARTFHPCVLSTCLKAGQRPLDPVRDIVDGREDPPPRNVCSQTDERCRLVEALP